MADALLVIDVQQALVDELPAERRAEFLGTFGSVIEKARSAAVPVVYVRHDGSPDELVPGTAQWQIASEIAPRAGEPIVDKRFGDAFEQTNLSEVLAAAGADSLIVTGMQTDYCVTKTIGGAVNRKFRVSLVEDAHATWASNGRSEPEIREDMHRDSRDRGVTLVRAAEIFA
jgi:nicotinamidase-related amidase